MKFSNSLSAALILAALLVALLPGGVALGQAAKAKAAGASARQDNSGGPRSLLLAGVHVLIGLAWLVAYTYFLGRLSAALRRPRVRRALEGVTGSLLIGLGGRLAWDRR